MNDLPRMVSTLYRKMQESLNILLEPLGLSSAQSMFIFCLWDHGSLTQARICELLDMDKSSVSKIIVKLEQDGFVTRRASEADIRAMEVSLTERALGLKEMAMTIHDEWVADVTKELSAGEKAIFHELLEKVSTGAAGLAGKVHAGK